MLIDSMDAFAEYLHSVEVSRTPVVNCMFTPEVSDKNKDAALLKALITGLPMVQGLQHRIVRSRGRGVLLSAKLRYRDGVRLLSGTVYTAEESAVMNIARSVAEQALQLDGADESFRYVYDWLCGRVRYVHTAPGQKGYERLVSAVGALIDRQANCQGFADALYLLCGLCGISCEYRCGRGEKRLHLWNVICLNGQWQDVDASKGARMHRD